MKKQNLSRKLNLQKSQVAILNTAAIVGGRLPETYHCRTRDTLYFKCSDLYCYTDVSCYHTETCQDPIGLSQVGCETQPPNC